MKEKCTMSGLPMNLSKQKDDIINNATAVPPKDGDFIWNDKDERMIAH